MKVSEEKDKQSSCRQTMTGKGSDLFYRLRPLVRPAPSVSCTFSEREKYQNRISTV